MVSILYNCACYAHNKPLVANGDIVMRNVATWVNIDMSHLDWLLCGLRTAIKLGLRGAKSAGGYILVCGS